MEYSDFSEQFAMQIGKYNLAILGEIKDLYLFDFGIFIDLSPDEEERQMLEANIQVALQQQTIDLEDAIDIRNIKNIKMANELLKLKRKKRMEYQQQQKQMEFQMQSQTNIQSQQAAAESKAQLLQMEAQSKIQLKEAEANYEIMKMQAEAEMKRELMALEFQYNMQLKGIDAEQLKTREQEKEKAKDKRIDLQASRQSELINQRKNNLPPINFESTEDSLDGFDLESFGPK
jgi:autotransporter translocation and assembly factor TamB